MPLGIHCLSRRWQLGRWAQGHRWAGIVLVCLLVGCTAAPPIGEEEAAAPAPVAEGTVTDVAAGLPRLNGMATVELSVNGETITLEVDGENAPVTAGNFVDLVQRGVYDGTAFHRVVREPEPFVAQAGDPQSKDPSFPPERLGTGGFIDPETGQERSIPLEIRPESAEEPLYNQTFSTVGINEPPALTHTRGAVAMARSQFPGSASSQFYITLEDKAFLNGEYAVFGYVTDGMDAVDSIEQGDTITSATVVAGGDNLVTD
ncbi:MAG: peptidylprolyl isomerase [Cyanobacteria bacterium J06648_16]